ncbi:MAG: hypothetical protein LBS31_01730 [Candidatus Adiutrix sp.]|nr:hypothetical protein [Candidatus Adiutrix sp.]
MPNLRFYVILAVGAIGLGLTALWFFVALGEPGPVQLAAGGFLLFAEFLTTALLVLIERQSGPPGGLMFRSGACAALGLYLTAAAVTALIFIFKTGGSFKWLAALELSFLGLLAAALAVLFAAAKTTAEGESGRPAQESGGSPNRGGY